MNKLIEKSLKTLFVTMLAVVATCCIVPEGSEDITGKVVINEVNSDAKYIELYNTSDVAVNLGGWTIRKNNEGAISDAHGLGSFVVAPGTMIPAKGFALINCKGANNAHNALNLGVDNSSLVGSHGL